MASLAATSMWHKYGQHELVSCDSRRTTKLSWRESRLLYTIISRLAKPRMALQLAHQKPWHPPGLSARLLALLLSHRLHVSILLPRRVQPLLQDCKQETK